MSDHDSYSALSANYTISVLLCSRDLLADCVGTDCPCGAAPQNTLHPLRACRIVPDKPLSPFVLLYRRPRLHLSHTNLRSGELSRLVDFNDCLLKDHDDDGSLSHCKRECTCALSR